MTKQEKIDNLILNENAYFFKKNFSTKLTKKLIDSTFKEASKEKTGNYLLKVIKKQETINGLQIEYSICIFKYSKKPTFIKEDIPQWKEEKLAYICIIDIMDYLSISKRNISGIKEIHKNMNPIDYNILTSIFVDENTLFEKFSMNNMNISDKAIRTKSVESNNLKENLSTFGLQSYILNNLRLSNDEDKISLTLNSSKINKFGNKNNLQYFMNWSIEIINKIMSSTQKESFITSFSTPQNFEEQSDDLNPISILITTNKLLSDLEDEKIENCNLVNYNEDGEITNKREINLIEIINKIKRLLPLTKKDNNLYKIKNKIADDLILIKNKKSLTIRSEKLKKIILEFTNERYVNILDYLNSTSSYVVTFDKPELVYTKRKLFKDNKLLGNIEDFLSVFKPTLDLNITTEKGTFSNSSTEFSSDSIFNFVENKYKDEFDYFICDDLGKEWADHIGLSEDNISFFHSKYKDSNFSASAFQDIIGQAQKNLGNLSPTENQWPMKNKLWSNNYNNDGAQTQIKRIRTGQNSEETINYFKKLSSKPNLSKNVYLVINFISKSELRDRLEKLKNEEDFQEKNEIIQILWFISSLISSCFEVNASVYIICKE